MTIAARRKIEAAELMVAMNKYTTNYARALLVATPEAQLIQSSKPKVIRGLTSEQVAQWNMLMGMPFHGDVYFGNRKISMQR